VAVLSAGDLGIRFAEAIAAKDEDGLVALLSPDVDFKALTPRKFWDAGSPEGVLDAVFGNWFEPDDRITEIVEVTTGDPVEDTAHVGYRFAVSNADGSHTVEQQAYYRTDGDRISYLRIVCSGYRPVTGG
jgi:ketosteroid isomerase-like protein